MIVTLNDFCCNLKIVNLGLRTDASSGRSNVRFGVCLGFGHVQEAGTLHTWHCLELGRM